MEQPSGQAKFLKANREKRGISLQTIHEGTKIPLDVLKAIEEGYKIRTLSPVYYKGFIKMYAQYLGVDVSQLTEEERSEAPTSLTTVSHPPLRTVEKKYKKNFPFKIEKLLVLIGGGILVLFLLSQLVIFIVQKIPFKKSNSVKVTSNIREQAKKVKKEKATPAVYVPPPVMNKPKVAAPVPSKPLVENILAETTPTTTVLKEETSPIAPPPPAVAEKSKKKIKLTVRAKKITWLQIQQDGEIVFQSTLKKGESESWTALDSIEISGRSIASWSLN